MTNKAAFQARFAHYERKPGLKVMRLHFEVPLEKGMETISILGEPTPDNDVWVGIALLTQEPARSNTQEPADNEEDSSKDRHPQKWHELKPSVQAGIRCDEQRFKRFLEEEFFGHFKTECGNSAAIVRSLCNVKSRSEFDVQGKPQQDWMWLDNKFQAWMAAG